MKLDLLAENDNSAFGPAVIIRLQTILDMCPKICEQVMREHSAEKLAVTWKEVKQLQAEVDAHYDNLIAMIQDGKWQDDPAFRNFADLVSRASHEISETVAWVGDRHARVSARK